MAGRKPEITNIELLREFALSSDPVLGANELADRLNMSRQGIDYRLRSLQDDGLLDSKVVSRDRVWWLTDAGRKELAQARD